MKNCVYGRELKRAETIRKRGIVFLNRSVSDAIMLWAKRYSDKAAWMAAQEADLRRKAELEQKTAATISNGRMDQYQDLYPYRGMDLRQRKHAA